LTPFDVVVYSVLAAVLSQQKIGDELPICSSDLFNRRSSQMRIKQRDVYTGRFFRSGNSRVVVLPPDLYEQAGLVVGDTVLMQYEHGIIWMVRATKSVLFDRTKVAKIFDSLFPDKADADASK